MNIFVLSGALLLFDPENTYGKFFHKKSIMCRGRDHLNIFIRVTYLQAQAL